MVSKREGQEPTIAQHKLAEVFVTNHTQFTINNIVTHHVPLAKHTSITNRTQLPKRGCYKSHAIYRTHSRTPN